MAFEADLYETSKVSPFCHANSELVVSGDILQVICNDGYIFGPDDYFDISFMEAGDDKLQLVERYFAGLVLGVCTYDFGVKDISTTHEPSDKFVGWFSE